MAGNPLYGIMCKFLPRRLIFSGYLLWHSLVRFDSIHLIPFDAYPDARCQRRNDDTHVLLCRVQYHLVIVRVFSVRSGYSVAWLHSEAMQLRASLLTMHFDFRLLLFANAHKQGSSSSLWHGQLRDFSPAYGLYSR